METLVSPVIENPLSLDKSYFNLLETLSTRGFEAVNTSRTVVKMSGHFTGERLARVLECMRRRKLEATCVYMANKVYMGFLKVRHPDYDVFTQDDLVKIGLVGTFVDNFVNNITVYTRREIPEGTVYITGSVPQEKETFDMLGTDSFNIGGVVKILVDTETED